MPTDKRQRQREGRQIRQAQVEAARRRSKRIRQGIVLGVVIVLVGVLAAVFGFSSNKKSTNVSATGSTTTTKAAAPPPPCPKPDGTSPKQTTFAAAPGMCIDPAKTYTAKITTDVGAFSIALDAKKAPKTANNFVFLARYHFYDGVVFHRVVQGFVVQGGDPTGTGRGGPGYTFADELPAAGAYKIGSVAMANSGANTNGSQFFIITGAQGTTLSPNYSLFGQVTSGMDVVKRIEADGAPATDSTGTPKVQHKMLTVTITEQ